MFGISSLQKNECDCFVQILHQHGYTESAILYIKACSKVLCTHVPYSIEMLLIAITTVSQI